jgi:adenylate cyclase, class 2
MALEVEQKYRVASHKPVLAVLAGWDVELSAPVQQRDCYYAHPQRDFAQTDEALRIRSVAEQNCLTYKGPKIDATTKTRIEHELAFASGTAASETCDAILSSLGFTRVATVTKLRTICGITRDGFALEIALDHVESVGTFVEIEAQLPDQQHLDDAHGLLQRIAAELGLSEVERRSYLELLLA